VVTIEITKCYNSAITVVESEGSGGYKGIAREAFRREGPERGSGRCEESETDDEEKKRKTSWRPETETSTEAGAHGFRCMVARRRFMQLVMEMMLRYCARYDGGLRLL
jgi:hypothetical protein